MPQPANPFEQLFKSDFTKSFPGFQSFPFDMKSVMELQRKNAQAVIAAQQVAMESLQAIAQRQSEIMSQIVEDNSSIAKEILSEGTPEQKIAKQADLVKKSHEKTVTNMRELADMIGKSTTEASDIINKRISASLSEVKTAMEKSKGRQAA